MSISPFGTQNIAAEVFSQYWRQYKEDAKALRRGEFRKNQDGYIGGLALAEGLYVKQAFREEDDAWLARQKRLTTINMCKRTVHCITDAVYGDASRHIRLRRTRSNSPKLPKEDAVLQQIIADANYRDFVKISGARNASINGTSIIGPYFDADLGTYKYRTRNIADVYPFPSANDGNRLDMLCIEIAMEDQIGPYLRLEIYTPWAIAVYRNNSRANYGFYPDPVATVEMGGKNPMENPYGAIPWVKFIAEPDVDEGMWYGLSDIRDVVEANLRINELLSIADKNAHDQGWSQMVLINFPDNVNDLSVGSDRAIRVGDGGDAKYIYPNLKISELLMLVDKLYKTSIELAGVPMASIRTSSESKSGVSLELELKPLADIAGDRRRRYTRTEGDLLKMTMLMHEVHSGGKTFTPQTAQKFFDKYEVVLDWADDLMPHDLTKEIDRDVKLLEAGLADPLALIEKYNELGGETAEQYQTKILKHIAALRSALEPAVDTATTPKGKPDGG